jgi:hypothetical protein
MKKTLLLAVLATGCNRPLITEADQGRRVEIDRGRVFTVSLPATTPPREIELTGDAIESLDCVTEEGRDQYVFRATHPGLARFSATGFAVEIAVWEPVVPVTRAGRAGCFRAHPGRCGRH